MDVEADGLFDEFLRDPEAVGQLPQLGAALGDGVVQVFQRDQAADGPFVRPVFMAAAGVHGGRLLLTFCLPSVLYTVIFTPLWFLITRGISRRLPSEVKR